MDKYQSVFFGEFTYSDNLTYEELLASEDFLLAKLEEILWDAGAEHLDFTPLGDILMVECVFTVQNLEILRDVAAEIASILPRGIRGKLICLERNLHSYHAFWLKRGQWQENHCRLEENAPVSAPINYVNMTEDDTE